MMQVLDLTRPMLTEPQLRQTLRADPSVDAIRVTYDDFDNNYYGFTGTVARIDNKGKRRFYYFVSESRDRYVPFEFTE